MSKILSYLLRFTTKEEQEIWTAFQVKCKSKRITAKDRIIQLMKKDAS